MSDIEFASSREISVTASTMGIWFYVTATQNHHVGFQIDGTHASGPAGQTDGPQVSLVCCGI